MNKQTQKQTQKQPIINLQSNRIRLIQQNSRLYKQILRLDITINTLFSQNNKNLSEQSQMDKKYKQQIKGQQLFIKKLKRKIVIIKNQAKPQQQEHLRKAIDELKFIQMEKYKYLKEKQAIIKKRKLKDNALELNKPVVEGKCLLLTNFKQTLRQNNQYRAKMLKIQKQIMYLHKIRESSKIPPTKTPENPAFQISKIQNQMNKIKKQINEIQKQWAPRIESFNTEYFLLKDIQKQKQKDMKEKSKTVNTFKNRILGMKQQAKILKQKERVSQVIISIEKRNQIKDKLTQQIQKAKWFQEMRKRPQKQGKKINPEKSLKNSFIKKSKPHSPSLQKFQIPYDSRYSQKIQNHNEFQITNLEKLKATAFSAKNQFISTEINTKQVFTQIKQQKQKQKQKINKKFANIAIGTTFYYNQNQDIQQKK